MTCENDLLCHHHQRERRHIHLSGIQTQKSEDDLWQREKQSGLLNPRLFRCSDSDSRGLWTRTNGFSSFPPSWSLQKSLWFRSSYSETEMVAAGMVVIIGWAWAKVDEGKHRRGWWWWEGGRMHHRQHAPVLHRHLQPDPDAPLQDAMPIMLLPLLPTSSSGSGSMSMKTIFWLAKVASFSFCSLVFV